DRERARREPAPPKNLPENRAGSPDPSPYDTMTSGHVISEYDNTADKSEDNQADRQTDKQVRPTTSTKAVVQADTPREPPETEAPARRDKRRNASGQEFPNVLEVRLAEAKRMAESPTTTVTLRVPQELNGWLD